MNIDWHAIFVPSTPILETIIRGSVMYLVLFVILRLTFRRSGSGGVQTPASGMLTTRIVDSRD